MGIQRHLYVASEKKVTISSTNDEENCLGKKTLTEVIKGKTNRGK